MPPIKGEEWKHVIIVEDKAENHPKVKCVYCSNVFVGSAARICNHLIGGRGMLAHVSTCRQVPDCVVQTSCQQVGQKEEVAIKNKRPVT